MRSRFWRSARARRTWWGGLALSLLLAVAFAPLAWAQKRQSTRPGEAAQRRTVQRRDPFRSLLLREGERIATQCPSPGKRGLVIPQLTLNGVVVTPAGYIAVVTMRGKNRAFFLRERDEVCEGYVDQITDDGVLFKQKARDAFGNEYERDVVKQLTG